MTDDSEYNPTVEPKKAKAWQNLLIESETAFERWTGIEALEQYRREWDDDAKTFKANALHDWTSHAADAFLSCAAGTSRRHKNRAAEASGYDGR